MMYWKFLFLVFLFRFSFFEWLLWKYIDTILLQTMEFSIWQAKLPVNSGCWWKVRPTIAELEDWLSSGNWFNSCIDLWSSFLNFKLRRWTVDRVIVIIWTSFLESEFQMCEMIVVLGCKAVSINVQYVAQCQVVEKSCVLIKKCGQHYRVGGLGDQVIVWELCYMC